MRRLQCSPVNRDSHIDQRLPRKGAQRRNITNFYSRSLPFSLISPLVLKFTIIGDQAVVEALIKSQVRSGEFSSHNRLHLVPSESTVT